MSEALHLLEPGSAAARAEGCICDEQTPELVDGPDGPLPRSRCEPMCPIHGLAVAHQLLHDEPENT